MIASDSISSLKADTCLAYSKCTINVGYLNEDRDDDDFGLLNQREYVLKGTEDFKT